MQNLNCLQGATKALLKLVQIVLKADNRNGVLHELVQLEYKDVQGGAEDRDKKNSISLLKCHKFE